MSATVYYDNPAESAVAVPVQFTNAAGANADPTSITCVVTSPLGVMTTYTYPASTQLTRTGSGAYNLALTGLVDSGLWVATWVGTGNTVNQVTPTTFRIVPLTAVGMGMQYWYVGKEELKSRLNISNADVASDYEMALAIQAATNWINTYCGEHFYQLTEARTFMPESIYTVRIDSLVSTPSILANAVVQVDNAGNGVYNTTWTVNQQFVWKTGTEAMNSMSDQFNINAAGVPRPYRALQILTNLPGVSGGGQFLPFVWPFSHYNRVQVTGTWGWNYIPPAVAHAAMMLAVDLFKSKDAPWGVAGMGDLGAVKVQSNPMIVELLRPYINVRRKVGV